MTHNRQRGGQPGNQNARTHGFYARALSPEHGQILENATAIKGLDQEIALLRSKIALAAENSAAYHDLVSGISLLARLLKTRNSPGGDKEDDSMAYVSKVWKTILPPGMDPARAYIILHKHVREHPEEPQSALSKAWCEDHGNQAGGSESPEIRRGTIE